MSRVSDYAVVRLHDGRFRLDRTTAARPGANRLRQTGHRPTWRTGRLEAAPDRRRARLPKQDLGLGGGSPGLHETPDCCRSKATCEQ